MGPPSSPNAACCAPRTPSRCVRWKLPADSDSPSPITGAALGVGYGDDKNGIGFLLKDHGIGKPRQYASASVLCIDGIELRMRNNLAKDAPISVKNPSAASGLRLKYHSNASLISS